MVALSPAVADARPLVDDEVVDADLIETCGHGQASLCAPDDENGWVAAFIVDGLSSCVFPVVTAEVARIGGASRGLV